MTITRRHMAFAGALALGASVLLSSSPSIGQSADVAAVTEAVAALTKAMLAADKAIVLSDQTVAVAGNAAIVRHAWAGESESGGKSTLSKIGILQVWQKQGASWKLLARQAFKP